MWSGVRGACSALARCGGATHPRKFLLAAIVVLIGMPLTARADADADGVEGEYADEGILELGGSIAASWTSDVFTVTATPTVGYFVADRIELSVGVVAGYTRVEDGETGESTDATSGAVVFEPSYHYPLGNDTYALVGLGFGPGWDDDDFLFAAVPRVGVNIARIGRSGVLTPDVRVPIELGSGGDGADVRLLVGLGFTTSF